jgi:hypothetical protein
MFFFESFLKKIYAFLKFFKEKITKNKEIFMKNKEK